MTDEATGILCGVMPKTPHPESEDGTCPKCKSSDVEGGYGMAAGGYGSYEMCMDCGCIFNATQDDDE